eukprot:jgi/Bigna1/76002/fgenesh1_pg.38_\
MHPSTRKNTPRKPQSLAGKVLPLCASTNIGLKRRAAISGNENASTRKRQKQKEEGVVKEDEEDCRFGPREIPTDFTFRVAGHALRTHKLILLSVSPVFRAMLHGEADCEELSCNEDVKELGVDEHTWSMFLQLLYPGTRLQDVVPLHVDGCFRKEVVNAILYLAFKYSVTSLVDSMESLLISERSPVDVDMLRMASRYHMKRYTQYCIETLIPGVIYQRQSSGHANRLLSSGVRDGGNGSFAREVSLICKESKSLSKETVVAVLHRCGQVFGSYRLVPRQDFERARVAWEILKETTSSRLCTKCLAEEHSVSETDNDRDSDGGQGRDQHH